MNTISIRLPDELLREIDVLAKKSKLPRAAYIRQAIEQMNKEILLQQRNARMASVSSRVRREGLKINAEFSEVEHDPGA